MKYILSLFIIIFSITTFAANEYREKTTKLNKIEKRIQEQDSKLKDLLKHKSLTQDKAEQKRLIDQSIVAHKTYLELVQEYNTLRKELRYKFPEQGDTTERRYLPIREQSLKEIEEETGMDSLLTRVKNKTLKKYKSFNKKETVSKQHEQSSTTETGGKKKRLRLEK